MTRRTRIGLLVTVGWVLAIAEGAFLYGSIDGMTLNAWGDFLAGVFAPLAFLWLVIGYFQQGDELQQNTESLRQQASSLAHQVLELRNSVEQQRLLASANEKQADLLRKQFDHQIALMRVDRQPVPELKLSEMQGAKAHPGGIAQPVTVKNLGFRATKVRINLDPNGTTGSVEMSPVRTAFWNSDRSLFFMLIYPKPAGKSKALVRFRYEDGIGADRTFSIEFRRAAEGPPTFKIVDFFEETDDVEALGTP